MVCNTIMEDTRAGKSVEEHPATLVEASGGQAAPGAGIQKAPVHLEWMLETIGRAEQVGTDEAKLRAYEAMKELISPLFHQAGILERTLKEFLESRPE